MDQAKFFNEGDGFTQHNNMRVVAVEKGFCRCEADLGPHSMNIHGFAHGGVAYTLCDAASGVAAASLGRMVVTRSASIQYLRPGRGEKLTAEARVVHAGRHTALCEARVYDDAGQLLVTAAVDMFFVEA